MNRDVSIYPGSSPSRLGASAKLPGVPHELHFAMSTVELCRQIEQGIDRVPPKRLASLAEYVRFLNQPTLPMRLAAAEKSIAAGKGVHWPKVRTDVK